MTIKSQPLGRMLLLREAAKKLRVSRNTMAKLIREGRVPSIDLSGTGTRRLVRIPENALDVFLMDRAAPRSGVSQ